MSDTEIKLYKFRSLDQFKFICDILVNHRLYAAKWEDLNDPMEFNFGFDLSDMKLANKIADRRDKYRVCSLASEYSNILLWSYYADGHKGVAIEITVDANDTRLSKVSYEPSLTKIDESYRDPERELDLLRQKSDLWSGEKEWRFVTDAEQEYITDVNVTAVYLGQRVPVNDRLLIQKIAKSFSQHRHINVVKTIADPQEKKVVAPIGAGIT